MSDSGRERNPKRPHAQAAGEDPWAKWRQPEAAPAPPEEGQGPDVQLGLPIAVEVREALFSLAVEVVHRDEGEAIDPSAKIR